MPGIYGGDDVSAIVLDAGTSTFRGGWAGDDAPRAVVPTPYSWLPAAASEGADGDGDEQMEGEKKKETRRRFVGEPGVAWREGAELDSPLQDGMGECGSGSADGERGRRRCGPWMWGRDARLGRAKLYSMARSSRAKSVAGPHGAAARCSSDEQSAG
jgi:hypothetical protein